MKILIFGANGFIGSNAIKYFQRKKYEVFGSNIKLYSPNVNEAHQSLNQLEELFQLQQFDYCINASGSSTVAFSLQNEKEDYWLNFKLVELLTGVLKKYQPKCKFLNLSSAAVYGNPSSLPILENDITLPISPYGKHKLLSEQLLLNTALKNELPTLSLRIFSVYGNELKKQLFWDIYQKSKVSAKIELYGTGNETRDFIHIDDLMLAFEQILLYAKFDGRSINVASGNETTIKMAAQILIDNLNTNLSLVFNGVQNKMDPKFWKADISNLKSLGFIANISLENGLKQYVRWLKELN